jgi:glycosyltransferase involved in cell wall biosynthesis
MKVLQLCHRIPFPANDGGNIAMQSIADAMMTQGVSLKMLALNTRKHFIDIKSLPHDVVSKYQLEAVPIDTSIQAKDAFLNLFTSESYNVKRFYSPHFEEKLSAVLKKEDFDVVVLESIFMTPYISAVRKLSKAKIVLRAHNIEHIIWQRLASNEKNPLKKSYLALLAKRLQKYEVDIIASLDAILPITPDDAKSFTQLGSKVPMRIIPVGIDTSKYLNQRNADSEILLFHLGSMDWRPNLEGVKWFLEDCWNWIHEKFPTLKLYLAGKHFPADLIARNDPGVICEGEVKDSDAFMNDKQIMIVPLKSGGGMRVKIIQGMALGKTIISTTIGAEGIEYTDKVNVLIADTPAEFLSAVEKCLSDKNYCLQIGNEAHKLALEKYSNKNIGNMLSSFFKSLTTKNLS